MPVKLKPASVIKAYLGIDPNGKVQSFFTNTCYKHMDKYVPMSNLRSRGDLRKNVDIQSNSITYESPYATYQYYGVREDGTHKINPENYTTPGTGTYWDKKMWSVEKDDVIEEVQRFMNRGA